VSHHALRLAKNVWRIPTARFDLVNSFVFAEADGSGLTLVDCGLKRAPARIVAGLAELGKAPGDVQRIILTHAHGDHAGGAATLQRKSGAPVVIHHDDAGHARAGLAPPYDASRFVGRLANRIGYGGFEPVEVARTLVDGEVLDVGGGLQVLHTPGHTPGHVSLLHPGSGVLITGDAIFDVFGLTWPIKSFCSDVVLTVQTARRLVEVDYDVAAFTHGRPISRHARERVATFLAKASR